MITQKKLKVDPSTPLENILLISSIVCFGFGTFYYINWKNMPIESVWISYIFWIASVLLIITWKKTDNYFIFDFEKKTLVYHFECMGNNRLDMIGNFSDIHSISLDSASMKTTAENTNRFSYEMVVLHKDGKKISLSGGATRCENMNEANQDAKNLASKMGIEFVPSEPGKKVFLEKASGSYYVEYR